jgi:hypothetical protein
MPSEHASPSLLSTFYHFLPLLLTHPAASQAIPPLFGHFRGSNERKDSGILVAPEHADNPRTIISRRETPPAEPEHGLKKTHSRQH